ncbi:MAG TPA: glycerol kinase GlpK [Candidatus Limnocylindrales bacterium]|nr:glycerol kinase GlpK [Candidatus Limnocylindrales bacterium]
MITTQMPDYIAAIDQGTTSTRFIIFDRQGAIVHCAQREHEQIYPQPGWVEHDPEEIWQRTREVMQEGLARSGLRPADLAAIGITNQRETAVVWDRRTGKAAAKAIVWQDTRVSGDVARLAREIGDPFFRSRTGLPLSTYFSALKLRWLLDNVPGLRRRAEAGEILCGNMDSFLAWRLTGGPQGGVHVTDVTNASRTQLMNLQTLAWDTELLHAFEIPPGMLPQIRSSSEIYGEVAEGELAGVPIAGILGDQQAALVGQACFERGETKNTYGTGCFLLMNTGGSLVPSTHGLLTTVAYKFGASPACYALEGSVAIAGALVQWLRDNLAMFKSSAEIEDLARAAEDNGGVYFVPAFSGLYAPYWNEGARGTIVGLTRYANRSHLARAVLEATAFQTRDVVQAMEKDSGIKLGVLRVDGGMVANRLLMQFQADILNRQVVRPAVTETTALGAAYAAGLATGWSKSTAELRAGWAADQTWTPALESRRRDQMYQQWKKAVGRAFDWAE